MELYLERTFPHVSEVVFPHVVCVGPTLLKSDQRLFDPYYGLVIIASFDDVHEFSKGIGKE